MERVDLHGRIRALESPEQLSAFQLPIDKIGIIKDIPAMRYLEGQDKWDKTFRRKAESVVKHREKYREKAETLLRNANDMNLLPKDNGIEAESMYREGSVNRRRWGPLDLVGENPPPSAIAGRRDTVGASQHISSFLLSSTFLL